VTQIFFNAAITASIYILCALSLTLVVRATGKFSFAIGYLVISGGYLFLAGGFFALLVGSIILGAIHYFFTLKPFHSKLLPLIATMAFGVFLESIISIYFGVDVKSLNVFSESINLFGGYITYLQLVMIFVALFISTIVLYCFHFTKWGLILRAGALSQSLGVNTEKISILTVIIGSLIAGIAGYFVGVDTNLSPTMGGFYSLKAFAVSVIGGVGSLYGCVVGGLFLSFVEQLILFISIGDFSVPSSYKDAVSFVLLLLVLLFRPDGLFQRRKRLV